MKLVIDRGTFTENIYMGKHGGISHLLLASLGLQNTSVSFVCFVMKEDSDLPRQFQQATGFIIVEWCLS